MKLHLLLLVVVLVAAHRVASAAIITWTNTAGGNWNVAANWSPNSVPGAADTAVITNDGTYTVTLNAAATLAGFTLGGASGTQTFANSALSLTLNGAGTVNANGVFALSGGTLTGTGDLTINSLFNWTGGNISGSGSVFANGGLTLSGSNRTLTGRTLVNAGAATWSAGGINMTAGGVLSNAATGTFDCAFDGNIGSAGGTGHPVANAGLFRKTAGTNTTLSAGILFNNTGTVEVKSGTLNLNGGGVDTGDFSIAPGTTLSLGNDTHSFTAGSITGAGSFSVSGGTANFAGTFGVTSALTVSGGAANFNGSSGAITPAQLNVSGGTLGGSNNVTVSGAMSWTGGNFSGTNKVFANGGLTLSGGTKTMAGRTLVNAGAATWSAGAINLSGGGVLSNAATGTFDCAFDGNIGSAAGTGHPVANAGLFRKTAGTNTTLSQGIPFHNTGMVNVQSGTLHLNSGGTDTGDFTVAPGASLNLGGGTHDLTAGNVTGTGTFSISGGTANFAGTFGLTSPLTVSGGAANFNGSSGGITPAQLNVSGGTFGGSNNVTVSGAMSWTGGNISGTNNVFANGGLTLSTTGNKTLAGRTLVNTGAATWSAGPINLTGGGVLSNAATGTFDCAFDGTISTAGGVGHPVANAGLFRKTAGTGATTLGQGIPFINTGTLELRTGVIRLDYGYVANPAGTVKVVLSGLTPRVHYGQLQVQGVATLGGTLRAELAGGFQPGFNQTYPILDCGTRTGTFDTFSGGNVGNGVFINVDYFAAGVNLVTDDATPAIPVIRANPTTGALTLRVTGIAGQTYVLEAATDLMTPGLTDWRPISTNAIPGSAFWEIVLTDLLNYPHRYFRARYAP